MRVISRRALRQFWEVHRRAEVSLQAWYKVAGGARWADFTQLRETFPNADQVGRLVVFNLAGNRFRLIARVEYKWQKVFVRQGLTHDEYDKEGWKRDAWL